MTCYCQDILKEIQEARERKSMSEEELIAEDCGCDNGIVLVACKDEHSCMQLEDCINKGSHKVLHIVFYKSMNLKFPCLTYFMFFLNGLPNMKFNGKIVL